MLTINREFKVSFDPRHIDEIKEKLQELNILILKTDCSNHKILEFEIPRFTLTCMCSEDKLNKLINYLQGEFKHHASLFL